jgi:hypothetical protein
MDHEYLNKLNDSEYRRLHWLATHPPRPLRLEDIPKFDGFEGHYKKLKYFKKDLKIFPTRKAYKFAAKKFGLPVVPCFQKGIPRDILKDVDDRQPPKSYHQVLARYWKESYYSRNMKMRICEISNGLIKKKTKLSFATIERANSWIRKYRYARRIWRGRPDPEDPRYLHSCYELPANLDHVIFWRINGFVKTKNDKRLKS